MGEWFEEIDKLRFHQKLLVNVIRNREAALDLLLVERDFSRREAEELHKLCEKVNKRFQIEKAEGYVHFQPLLNELRKKLNPKIAFSELTRSCIQQGLYLELMKEMEAENRS